MTSQPFRLPAGGRIDRARPLAFTFDGRRLEGYAGDTLASALLANGVRLVGRSFKYHRPRGILSAGSEEPNALVTIGVGRHAEPNTRATMQPLYDGLVAQSQNRWPALGCDLLRVNELFGALLPAGFYYKTFMWPAAGWRFYEHLIRRAAGLGRPVDGADPDFYAQRYASCDVLVVGGGAAGIAAAEAAVRGGASVILVDENALLGGRLIDEGRSIGGRPAAEWVDTAAAVLAAAPNCRVMTRTTAFGLYDHHMVALAERISETHGEGGVAPRQRRWQVRAKRIVLATGAIEQPLLFAGNDLPGVMLSGAVRRYVRRQAVAPGRQAVVFANNPDAYETAIALAESGVRVAALVDARAQAGGIAAARLAAHGIAHLTGSAVIAAHGRRGVEAVEVRALDEGGRPLRRGTRIACDLLCVSGGFQPAVHLHSQRGGRLVHDPALHAFVPRQEATGIAIAGAARGRFALADCIADGIAAGRDLTVAAPAGIATDPEDPWSIRPLGDPGGRGKRFVDLQNDVLSRDLALAVREGYRAIEHVKRYTTLGMGTDQGKTSSLAGIAEVAAARGEAPAEIGTTTFRPPYTPVTLGALAGDAKGAHFDPVRHGPLHDWQQAQGAVWIQAGLWLRARAYPRLGESFDAAWKREALCVRRGVGLFDVSSLGKIAVEGPDAAAFLDRVYCCAIGSLAVGRCRYALMLREDGIILDDGTVTRIGAASFLLTTTTVHAGKIFAHLEFLARAAWPELRVHLVAVTDQFAQMALAGPASRTVLARLTRSEIADAALPHLGFAALEIGGIAARVFRMSFSGELTYEIAVPAAQGEGVWTALLAAGADDGIMPCGVESLGVLRIEKGNVAGAEIDGRTTPADLGLGRFVSARKSFVGRSLLGRPALSDPDRLVLVGLEPIDGRSAMRSGAQLLDPEGASPPDAAILGHVTSSTYSPTLGRPIALALLARGQERMGRILDAASPLFAERVAARVVPPRFYDPENTRLHG